MKRTFKFRFFTKYFIVFLPFAWNLFNYGCNMPQELRVVCCCSCEMFQSDIVKKVNKWTCKVCHEKQSLQKIYFLGSGKECRKVTQELNMRRSQLKGGKLEMERVAIKEEGVEIDDADFKCEHVDKIHQVTVKSEINQEGSDNILGTSKWDCFVTDNNQENDYDSKSNSSNLLVVKNEVDIGTKIDKTKKFAGTIEGPNNNDNLKNISVNNKVNHSETVEPPSKRFKVEDIDEVDQIQVEDVVEMQGYLFEDVNEDISDLFEI